MPRRKKTTTTIESPKRGKPLQLVKGTKDILPEEQPEWNLIRDKVREMAESYGFYRIDTPVVEDVNVFIRGVGQDTDIVDKEIFSFEDKGGNIICLRPENTASIARTYIEHGFSNRPQPVKLYYFGPMFRYDSPQSGRQRQFYQFGFEVLGSSSPASDAQMILIAATILEAMGLHDFNIQINSIGCAACRAEYKESLSDFYKGQMSRLCSDCKRRIKNNPLRLLDCKEEKCQRLANQAPALIDSLCDECHDHFKEVLEHLDELQIVYNLNSKLVRGLDYYTRTVFEFWPGKQARKKKSQSAIVGGGRYDDLIKSLGGEEIPGVGFSCGIERLILSLQEAKVKFPKPKEPEVFLAQLGKLAKRKALVLFEDLRKRGILVAESFSRDSLKSQLKVADRMGAKITLILGQKEALENTILVRNMETGVQEVVDIKKVGSEVRKRLRKK